MANEKGLQDTIALFLSEHRASVDGYAPVTDEDYDALCQIIHELIELKFERDPDGDLPIEFQLADRNRERFVNIPKMPYCESNDIGERLNHMRTLSGMLNSVQTEISVAVNQMIEMQARKKREEAKDV